jgi:hypothetical protein
MKRLLILVLIPSFNSVAALASDNLLVNGGFESPPPFVQPERFYSGRDLGGWLVGGEVDQYVSLNWDPLNAVDGNQYLYMSDGAGGHISQAVNLQVGRQYTFEFHVFSDSTDFHNLPQYEVDVVSEYPADTLQYSRVLANPTFTAKYNPVTSPAPLFQWTTFAFDFTAQANQERLSIHSPGYYFLIDAISIVEVPVPEPSSLVLVVFGLGGLHWSRRRSGL